MTVLPIVLDTNVFVAAGFRRTSASARIVQCVRAGQLQMIWHDHTRRETQRILQKIPPLSWDACADLFRATGRYGGCLHPEEFSTIPDPDDRKYAALCAATGALLVTSDAHLLQTPDDSAFDVFTPGGFWRRFAPATT